MSRVMTATTYEDQDREVLPAKAYRAKVVGFSEPQTGEFGDYIFLRAEVTRGPKKGVEFAGVASYKLGPKTKLRGWLESILGREFHPNEQVDLDDFVGREATFQLTVDNGGDTPRNKVINVVGLDDDDVAPSTSDSVSF
jgi:hypothetical protein